MNLENTVKPYIDAINNGIKEENWILAVMGALTLPDICSGIHPVPEKDEKIKENTKHLKMTKNAKKYISWFQKYCTNYELIFLKSKTDKRLETLEDFKEYLKLDQTKKEEYFEETKYEYFNGVLAYAFRCSVLHAGTGVIDIQPIHKSNKDSTLNINKVLLDVSAENRVLSQKGNVIYLNPKHFCEEMIDSVYKWIQVNEGNENIKNRSIELIATTK